VSQLNKLGELRPEQISKRLWDLSDAVKHIAQQYADIHLSRCPSSADHPEDDGSINRSPVSSNPPCPGD